MSNGIILAGGKGSRLGPLSAQISKALVSIGQRPHIFHQLELLRAAGCTQLVVMASRSSRQQIHDMLIRAGVTDVLVETQWEPLGPVHAIMCALDAPGIIKSKDAYVLFSDTYIDESLDHGEASWVGEWNAPVERSFCVWDDRTSQFIDRVVKPGISVTIGAYHFANTHLAMITAKRAYAEYSPAYPEVPMGPFLSALSRNGLKEAYFPSWLDIGDVSALGSARRTRFISRGSHRLVLDEAGLITKSVQAADSGFTAQLAWLKAQQEMRPSSATLVPHVYQSSMTSYTMEYVDLPTLSELWLYWPGRADVWQDILHRITERLRHDLWSQFPSFARASDQVEVQWFVRKAMHRLKRWDAERYDACAKLLAIAETEILRYDQPNIVRAHGDLNFNNILYSINTGAIKLLDPRGDSFMPLTYELAKLRYSYHAGFSAITHGLDITKLHRDREIDAMDAVIGQFVDLTKCTILEALLLLAGAPLHDRAEANVMYERGKQMLEKVLQ